MKPGEMTQIDSLNPKRPDHGLRKEPCTGCGVPTVTIGPPHEVMCNKCSGKSPAEREKTE